MPCLSRQIACRAAIFFALGFPLGAPASAQPRIAVAAGKWNVDYGNIRCSLARRTGGPQSPILALASNLGSDEPELVLIRDGDEPLPDLGDRVRVVLEPSAHSVEVKLERRRVQGGRIMTIPRLGEGFIDRFAASEAIRLEHRGKVLVDLRLPGAAKAVAAYRSCNDDLLKSWGADPALEASLTRRARQRSGSISDADYPPSAISAGQSGKVVARFRVLANGRPADCHTVVPSGHTILDRTTCALLMERFRFEPALDGAGKPVPSIVIRTVTWMLP